MKKYERLKVKDFTVPELEKLRALCNFTDDEKSGM